MTWDISSITRGKWGSIQIVIDGVDVTFYRDTPTQIQGLSYGEPFDDKLATLYFPQITIFEQINNVDYGVSGEDPTWLRPWAPVEIYMIPPNYVGPGDESIIFEGFATSFNSSVSAEEQGITVEVMGALYQADLYVRAPIYPRDFIPIEILIGHGLTFNNGTRPHLQTGVSWWDFPGDWPIQTDDGEDITGFFTRRTGSWDRLLTGYVQNELGLMINPASPSHEDYDDQSYGSYEGRQWTLMMDSPGRIPHFQMKDTTTVDHTVTAGTPGIEHSLNADFSQTVNVIYGEGTDAAEVTWRNANREPGSQHTTYDPVGFDPNVHGDDMDKDWFRIETHYTYGGGVSLAQAQQSAGKQVERDKEPGWNGSITLSVDPESGSRFDIRAGENILMKEFAGSGQTGVLFHISGVEIDFNSGAVTLTVDTKARDEATLAEIISRRASDAIYPTRTLVPVTRSRLTEDDKQPWDYDAGSGYIPLDYKDFSGSHTDAGNTPADDTFSPVTTHGNYVTNVGNFYVAVTGSSDVNRRWAFFPIATATQFTAEKVTLTAYDSAGNITPVRFHWGLYKIKVGLNDMPEDDTGAHNPLGENAFDSANTPTHPDRVITWGQESQAAGYWPGRETDGDTITGQFVDEGTWQFSHHPGEAEMWVAIYVDASSGTYYFSGRITHSNHVPFDDSYADEVI